jgi:hypothetical protein
LEKRKVVDHKQRREGSSSIDHIGQSHVGGFEGVDWSQDPVEEEVEGCCYTETFSLSKDGEEGRSGGS